MICALVYISHLLKTNDSFVLEMEFHYSHYSLKIMALNDVRFLF